jgi:hypothetical protein
VFADLAREGSQPWRPLAALPEKPAGRVQGAEGRSHVSELHRREGAVFRCARQGVADFAHPAERRTIAGGENQARLAGLGKALPDTFERRFEKCGRPGGSRVFCGTLKLTCTF